MHRIFLPDIDSVKKIVQICDKDNLHYLLDVLRLGVGKILEGFDGKGKEFYGRIKKIDKKAITIEIINSKKTTPTGGLKITLACAIPKKAKLDDIIEKTTELGVDRIIPMITERTVVKLDVKKSLSKLNRWKKIGEEASRQSCRTILPKIEEIRKFSEVLKETKLFDLAIIGCLYGERKDLSEILNYFKGKSILALIGPEGDFSMSEIKQARQAGCITVKFTDAVLKVDTAAIYLVSAIKFSAK